MKQCDNGHFYDENRFESCPYCQEGAGVGKTVAASSVGKTVAAVPGGSIPDVDRGKTVGIIKKKIGIDPAVGFLVCVSGPHRGADYKLVAGRNFIGRAAAMDVALADDDTVSRESHALVTYDAKHNSFSLSPGQGRGITYCNDEQVEMVRPLKAYDVIEVGKSQLLFLPLCGEQFQWNGGVKDGACTFMVKPAAVSGCRHPRLDGGCGGRSASIGADSRLFPDTAEEEKEAG